MFLSNPWVKEQIISTLENILSWMVIETQHINICGMRQKPVFKYKFTASNGYNREEEKF